MHLWEHTGNLWTPENVWGGDWKFLFVMEIMCSVVCKYAYIRNETETKEIQVETFVVCINAKGKFLSMIGSTRRIVQINHFCGYGSIFGDENTIRAEFCQSCIKDILGAYLKIEE